MNSDTTLKEYIKTYKRMDRRQYAKGAKYITVDEWEDFKSTGLKMENDYKSGTIKQEVFFKWLKKYK